MSNTLHQRFWPKVNKTETCWLWTASTKNGYGQIGAGGKHGKPLYAHRVAYELVNGPIPEGLHLDHLCRVTLCVNPAHLEPVTRRENILRGESPIAKQARKTECLRGHPLSGANLYTDPKGKRSCKICRNEAVKRLYRRRKANQ
jgi:HNH endonuclease